MDEHEKQYPGRTAFLETWAKANADQRLALYDDAVKYGVLSKSNTVEDYYRRANEDTQERIRFERQSTGRGSRKMGDER